MSIEAPDLQAEPIMPVMEEKPAAPSQPPIDIRIGVEAISPQESLVKRGRFSKGVIIGVGGTLGVIALIKGGVLPGVGAHTKVEAQPAVITDVFQMERVCYAGFSAISEARAEAHAAIESGDIPVINTGLHVDKEIKGMWISEDVKGTVEEKICQQDDQVIMEYRPVDKTVTLAIPNSALHFEAEMLANRLVTPDAGLLMVPTENLNNEWRVLTDKGLPKAMNEARSRLEGLATMEAVENVVERCTPTVRDYYEDVFVAKNIDRILNQAKVFNVPLERSNVSVVFTGENPMYVSRYNNQLKLLKDNKHVHLQISEQGKCTTTSNAADEIKRTRTELADIDKAFKGNQ